MNNIQTLKDKLTAFFNFGRTSSLDNEDVSAINQTGNTRNKTIMAITMLILCVLGGGFLLLNGQSKKTSLFAQSPTHHFGAVVDSQFSSQDAQSAERDNASVLDDLAKAFARFKQENEMLVNDNENVKAQLKTQEQMFLNMKASLEKQVDDALEMARSVTGLGQGESSTLGVTSEDNDTLGASEQKSTNQTLANQALTDQALNANAAVNKATSDPFYYPNSPRYADDPQMVSMAKQGQRKVSAQNLQSAGIDSFTFSSPSKVSSLNYKDYVPAGSFVTAVMTGGAEASAGVGGESDTAPVTFRMLNQGFLPNGRHSKLKGCFMTAAAYGDISSSRGIVRGDRLSCIRKNGSVLDIPIEATVFNFGKNGIRGNAIMRNSKIIGAAGTAGLLSGLGSAATGMSKTQSTSALGSTSSVDPSKIPLSILGGATEKVASQLSEYYIKLAEKYHPDIDLQQGAIVNIVFLKGFPLHGNAVSEYTNKLNKSREAKESTLTQLTSNPVAVLNSLPLKQTQGALNARF